jgi:hypothetical protein
MVAQQAGPPLLHLQGEGGGRVEAEAAAEGEEGLKLERGKGELAAGAAGKGRRVSPPPRAARARPAWRARRGASGFARGAPRG